jgi:tricorn protease-like protein/C-terminal processing protease CtpA/Prc
MHTFNRLATRSAAVLLLAAGQLAAAQETTPHAGMLRYPDVSKSHIVFSYANDLWIVPKDGGTATKLSSPSGLEGLAKFSPDGNSLAFIANYDGGNDLYTMSVTGGVPKRVTHHPSAEWLTDWTPQGELLYFMNGLEGLGRQTGIFTVSPEGGLPDRVPVPYGANGSMSPDGKWIAYTPHTRDTRTWKRYRGGMATDIWIFNVETYESRKITDWEGTDTIPMWHGSKVYYLSDNGPEHRLNIWSYDTKTDEREQITDFADYDCKFPSIGPGSRGEGEIVFQNGSTLQLLNLRSKRSKAIEVSVPGDRPKLRHRTVNAADYIAAGAISSTGKRAVVEARGDIWTVPAKNGAPRQITDTSGSAERNPAWSPDGRWISYFSDESGEYELYITQSDGKGETRKLTDTGHNYFFGTAWSPDSKMILVTDKAGAITLIDVESGEAKQIDRDEWANQPAVSWSHDSRYVTYNKSEPESLSSAIWIYEVESGETRKVTSGFFNDTNPVFSQKGNFLYYVSNREFTTPKYEDVGSTFIYDRTGKLIAVPLNSEVENAWLVEPDDETWEDEKAEDDENADNAEDEGDEAADEADSAEDEQADDADEAEDNEADESEEGDNPEDNFLVDHPLHGIWVGKVNGVGQIPGMTEDSIDFKMTILAHADGSFSGTSETMGESSAYDSVEFDEATGKFVATRAQGPVTSKVEGTLSGESMSGTWSIVEMSISGTWEATKSDEKPDLSDVEESSEEAEPVEIDFEGFEARGFELPIGAGNYGSLVSNDKGQLIYMSMSDAGPSIKLFDPTDEEPSEKTVLGGAGLVDISGDGKKLLVAQGSNRFAIVSAAAGQSFSDALDASGLTKIVNPREEWEQIFTDAWRRHRDFFYVNNLHGVDWDAIYKQYHAMLKDAASREDVSFIIGEMIAELNVGHAYYWGGDGESAPTRPVGLLGVDYEIATETDDEGVDHTAYRIAKIYEGADWDSDARNPLNQLGMDVDEGTYIIAVNGRKLNTDEDPWAAFIGTAGKQTTITFADALVGDDETRNVRDYTLEPMGSESNLRYRAWIEHNRQYVEDATGGKVGYIYVPDTGVNGQNNLFRQFYGQIGKDALIIDERWNGGGQIPTRFIELLNRPRTNYWARRDGKDWPWPYDSHQGPKCMLINGLAGSGGDMFPWLFRYNELGKLIGMRTWGGLVGISGVPGLIDGGYTAVPTFGFYETDGTWGIEGHGVEPDIEVIDDPSQLARGKDPQLDAAIAEMLAEIENNPYTPAARPSDPDRSGMGIEDSDR